jgi:hypothetical protein
VQAKQEAVGQEQAGVVSERVFRHFDGRTEENNAKYVKVLQRGTFGNLARNN